MSFPLSAEQEAYRKKVREFSSRVIAPMARRMDAKDEMPAEIWRHFTEQGFPAMPIPREYGGSGQGLLEQSLMMESVTTILLVFVVK